MRATQTNTQLHVGVVKDEFNNSLWYDVVGISNNVKFNEEITVYVTTYRCSKIKRRTNYFQMLQLDKLLKMKNGGNGCGRCKLVKGKVKKGCRKHYPPTQGFARLKEIKL